jgi:hypothetical protein
VDEERLMKEEMMMEPKCSMWIKVPPAHFHHSGANCFIIGGERGRNRTYNLLIKSQLLCQLSYAPDRGGAGARGANFLIVASPGILNH